MANPVGVVNGQDERARNPLVDIFVGFTDGKE